MKCTKCGEAFTRPDTSNMCPTCWEAHDKKTREYSRTVEIVMDKMTAELKAEDARLTAKLAQLTQEHARLIAENARLTARKGVKKA